MLEPILWLYEFFDLLLSTYCTEGLIGLSVRWIHPSQQHGRRIPSLSSLIVLLTCSFLVSSFLTKVTQHIHSLRARGVRFSQAANAFESEVKASRKSAGTLCTTPLETAFLVIELFLRQSNQTLFILTENILLQLMLELISTDRDAPQYT